MSKCPKCGEKIKPTYLKAECPKCGVNMLYYKMDERLAEDAKNAQREVDAVNRFLNIIKDSTIKTPWHIVRLVLFFAPLASMCLPMFWAGHKKVSLISFILSIVNHGFDLGAIAADKSYLFAVLSIVCVIVFSLVEIICSLFSATKNGYMRNMVAFTVNLVVLITMTALAIGFGAGTRIGLEITLAIYFVKLVLHNVADKKQIKKSGALAVLTVAAIILSACSLNRPEARDYTAPQAENGAVSVVSYNVASVFGTSFDDTDSMVRCGRFASYINQISPDLIGTQEMNSYWLNELGSTMPDYASYGVKRGGDGDEKSSEMNAVFWKKAKFSSLEQNTIWLSETPNEESKYTYIDDEGNPAEAGCYRICSYVALVDNQTGEQLLFLNTHLDNASEQAADFGANVIMEKIEALKTKYGDNAKIVLTGDFNETDDGEAYKLVAQKLNDCTDKSKETATYQEWGYCNTGGKPIDFIFTTGSGSGYTVLNDLNNGYVSDHYGIYSNITF